jgi:hypothetical protein
MKILRIKRMINLFLASSLFWSTCMVGLVQAQQVDMISTEAAMLQSTTDTRSELRSLLSRTDVQAALESAGIPVEEAQARVNSMNEMELASIQQQLDELPAGAGAGSIVGAVVFIFLVLLITDILGLTDVFDFVKK